MNKLINVNIGGIVFQIDEQAYQKLDAYLNAIKNKYASSPEGDEIIRDIENRIAEIFTEKYKGGPVSPIMMKDVEEIISIMGNPEDFESAPQDNKNANAENANQNTDQKRTRTSFYRDGESRILGGVCSGFAQHFDVDPLWIRLAFIIAFFFFGTGLLLYLVLWIIIPEAKTTAEKIEMRGDRVNISNIEKTIKDEAKEFGNRMKDLGNEMKQTFSGNKDYPRSSLGKFIEDAAHAFIRIFVVFIKVIVGVVVAASLVTLVVLGVSLMDHSSRLHGQIDFVTIHIFDSQSQFFYVSICALALIIIPLIGLIYKGIKFVINSKRRHQGIGWTLLGLWLIALIIVTINCVRLSRDFRYTGRSVEHLQMEQPATGKLIVKLDDSQEKNLRSDSEIYEDWYDVKIYDDTVIYKDISLSIGKSTDSLFSVTVIKSAKGRTPELSRDRAEKFTYTIHTADDQILIPSSILLAKDDLFRHQEVEIVINVPVGKQIQVDPALEKYEDNNNDTDDYQY